MRRLQPLASSVHIVHNEPDRELFMGSNLGTFFYEISGV